MTAKALVGYTGFVGSNLNSQAHFDGLYHSRNINDAYGKNPGLLVYCGLRAEKFLANQYPEKDLKSVEEAFANIQKINPGKLVLISTIDVYKTPCRVDEGSEVEMEGLEPYGANRYRLEQMVREAYPGCLIVRLPGLYGINLKKNFIYDLIHRIPSMLNAQKYSELQGRSPFIGQCYEELDNGFFRLKPCPAEINQELKAFFQGIGFTALNFTDSRGIFQFYPLPRLWDDISIALEHKIPILNLAPEPVRISDLYRFVTGGEFANELPKAIPHYDFRTKYADLFAGSNGYLVDKSFVLKDIKGFVEKQLAE